MGTMITELAINAPTRTRKLTTVYFYNHETRHEATRLAKQQIAQKLNAYTRDATTFLAEKECTDRVVIMPGVPEHLRGPIRRTYADAEIDEPGHMPPKATKPEPVIAEPPPFEEERPLPQDVAAFDGLSTARLQKELRKLGLDPSAFRGNRDEMIRTLTEHQLNPTPAST